MVNLRKRRMLFFYVSYGVLTEFLRKNVILMYFATETATATATAMDTECWKSAKSQPWYPKQIQVFNENKHRHSSQNASSSTHMSPTGMVKQLLLSTFVGLCRPGKLRIRLMFTARKSIHK